MRFARRTEWELTPNKITGILEDFKKNGQKILDLTESNPTRCGFAYSQNGLLNQLATPDNMLYVPLTQGLLSSRQAIAAYYQNQNIAISPDQIFLTASTSEAYTFLFRLLADPGDTVLFPSPSYPLFDFLVDLNDLERGFYPLVYNDTWVVDFAELGNHITRQTKAIVTVNPNNPTGTFIKKEELAQLNKVCCAARCALISDEVFFDYAFDRKAHFLSFAANTENLTFTLGGLSKTLGLPQMKLSWIVVNGPQDMMREAIGRLEVIADTYLSVNTPVQNALPSWLASRPVIQDEIMKRVCTNREYLLRNFTDHRLGTVLHADGGWYLILKLIGSVDEEELIEQLLLEDQVYVHPGYFFNFNEGSYLILSLLPLTKTFSEGVTRITARLKKQL
ncbi:MAG: pyridoxal phosphate-dependent aminotransferase [Candidatus Omnitrophica bacterium]|nr:pyridoxal phosphate-dependent aminotransferase [Candidatus Omnitrophota bacterium]